MRTNSQFNRLGETVLAGVLLCGPTEAQTSKLTAREDLRIVLSSTVSELCPYEALPLRLSLTNISMDPVVIGEEPLNGEYLDHYAEITQPDGSTIRLHGVQVSLDSRCGREPYTLAAGGRREFALRMGQGLGEGVPAFATQGDFRIVVVMGASRSNPLLVTCLPPPDAEAGALALLHAIRPVESLAGYFDGRLLGASRWGRERMAQLEALAWYPGSRIYASHAKLALADCSMDIALALSSRETTRARDLLEDAHTLLVAIAPGSAIGHAGQPESHVARRLEELAALDELLRAQAIGR